MRISRVLAVLSATLLVLTGLTAPTLAVEPPKAPPEFVALSDVDRTIMQDIRYKGRHNFVGEPIDAYLAPLCILTRPSAEALRAAQRRLVPMGYSLKVYDCYRPQTAVDHFVRWAQALDDQRMKTEFYPRVDKSRLFEDGYIAEKSGHSRGSTVDLTLVRLPAVPQRPYLPGTPQVPCFAPDRWRDNSVEMGTEFDCFDVLSHTDHPEITGVARANRDLLREVLTDVGFTNYSEEWWHYTLDGEPFPDTYFDFPVSRGALSS